MDKTVARLNAPIDIARLKAPLDIPRLEAPMEMFLLNSHDGGMMTVLVGIAANHLQGANRVPNAPFMHAYEVLYAFIAPRSRMLCTVQR